MTVEVTLTTIDRQQRQLVSSEGDTRPATAPIPCFQCGVCCIKWQPLLDPAEVRRLAEGLGIAARTFRRRYVKPFPLRRGWGILRTGALGCTFLRFRDGRALCSIYQIRPQVCGEWAAGLDKTECVEGLQRIGGGELLTVGELYAGSSERDALTTQAGAQS